jgi:hypothetical protein
MAPTLPRTPGKWWWTKWTASSTGNIWIALLNQVFI